MTHRLQLVAAMLASLAALASCTVPASDTLAIRNVTVIPVTGAAPIPNATVLIIGDRILAVGSASETEMPVGTRVIDGTGRFLIPGLIEMHGHLSKARASALGLYVANGVTTVRDMGSEHAEALQWRREVRSGQRLGPRLLIAGPYLEAARNIERMRRDPPEARVEPFERARIGIGSPEQARRVVDSLANLELDYLKIRTVQDRETYLALNAAAEARGLKLVGHAFGSPEQVLEGGQDGVDHFFYPTLDSLTRDQRLAIWRRFAERGVFVVPTLVTMVNSTLADPARLRAMLEDSLGELEPRRRYLSRFMILDWREQILEMPTGERRTLVERLFGSIVRNTREMHEAGVEVLAGSDVAVLGVFPGSSLHEEMSIFVERLGMTPAEALERATRRSARALGIADSVGTIQPGRIADLVLLDADPLQDIRNVRRISAVFLRGTAHQVNDLARILAAIDTARDRRTNDWIR
jgi:imidazolonepropionase-like amidohydrolase